MAETAAPAQPAAAPGPAPNGAGAPSPGAAPSDAGRLSGLNDEQTRAAMAAFDGDGAGEVPLQTKTGTQPSAPAATDDTGAGAETKEEAPAPSPFDEELAALTPQGEKPANTEALPDLTTDEAIQKALNPTGQISEAEQLKHAQKFIGQQSARVRDAEQRVAKFQELLDPILSRDAAGNAIGVDILKLADALGQDGVAAALESRGLKLVPADWGPEQSALEKEYPRDLVDQLVPTKEMSFEEKVELIKGDVEKLVDLRTAKNDRVRQQQYQAHQQMAIAQQELMGRLEAFKKADKGFEALAKRSAPDKPDSLLDKWNAQLPDSIDGALRAELVYRLAKLDRLSSPQVRKEMADAIYKRAEADLLKKYNLAVPVGGGGVLVGAGSRRSGGDSEFAPMQGAVEALG